MIIAYDVKTKTICGAKVLVVNGCVLPFEVHKATDGKGWYLYRPHYSPKSFCYFKRLKDLKDACVVFLEGAELKHSAWVDTLTLCMETGSSNIVSLERRES